MDKHPIGLSLALLLLTIPLLAQSDKDPISNDPVTVDAKFPAAMVESSFESDGSRINAIMYLAQGEGPHPTVVLLHGFPGNEKNLDLAQAMRRTGINVLFFHYRGSWGSEGDYSFTHGLEDVSAALSYLRSEESQKERRVDAAQIAVVGHSLGGFFALKTAAADSEVACTVSIAGANLGAFASLIEANPDIEGAVAKALQQGMGPLRGTSGQALVDEIHEGGDAWDLVAGVETLASLRLFLIAGSRDITAPMALHHQPLVDALKESESKEVTELVLDADHAFSDKRVSLIRAIVGWLKSECGF